NPDFERETSGFLGIFDKLGLGISRRQPPGSPRLDLEDDPKSEYRKSVLIFDAGSPIVEEF
ncbi:16737_t:CDS:1, partial [Dentiscutata heterogama]